MPVFFRIDHQALLPLGAIDASLAWQADDRFFRCDHQVINVGLEENAEKAL